MESEIKVSVCVVTYNQEKYIAQCLQSLVDQETNFKFEIIVGEDCSTDSTREIIEEFVVKYPSIVRPLFRDMNLGGGENYTQTHAAAMGQYIVHMDGDDYSLPGKLQLQVDFLDNNPDCNIVWHPVNTLHPDGTLTEVSTTSLYSKKFYRKDIIKLIAIAANSSKMYRKSVRDFDLPGFELVDYFANVEQVKGGYAAFASDKALGVYRSGIGVASSGPKTRVILTQCFAFFANKYPENRLHANTAAFTYLIADSINLRSTALLFFKSFVLTFHPLFLFEFIKTIPVIKMMKGR